MAAFPPPARPSTPSSTRHEPDRTSARRPLPHGACNFRDLQVGRQAPTCGCRRFWCSGHGDTAGDAAAQRRAAQSDWCVCGHHACYHDSNERAHNASPRAKAGSPITLATAHGGLEEQTPVYVQLVSATGNGRFQLVAGSQPVILKGMGRGTPLGTNRTPVVDELPNSQEEAGSSRRQDKPSAGTVAGAQAEQPGLGSGNSSSLRTSGLPPVPSRCRLTSDELRIFNELIASHRPGSQEAPGAPNGGNGKPNRLSPAAGLGLYFQPRSRDGSILRQSPTIADSQLPSTVYPSGDEAETRRSPSRAFMQHVLSNRAQVPPLNVPVTIPGGAALEDIMQSATELATPSNANTPELGGLTQTVEDTKRLAENLTHSLNPLQRKANVPGDEAQSTSQSETAPHDPTAVGPSGDSDQRIRNDLQQLPGTLQRLLPYLGTLHQHLLTYPQLSTSIQTHADRIEALETASFSHVPAEDLLEKLELVDARILDLEGRAEEHEKFHAAIEHDSSSREGATHRRGSIVDPNQSFQSNGSLPSETSSALISAAIRNVETESRLKDVEGRLQDLESVAQPSFARPWEVDVILLPWGPDLRGIWFSPDDSILRASRATTQASEEWSQARSSRSVPRPTFTSQDDSGWSSRTIREWAASTDEWLSPKACAQKSVVYARLKSRGLVRTVSLVHPGAREIQATICKAFGGLLDTISGSPGGPSDTPDEDSTSFFGLEAPFIPFRKIHKSSRLAFLTPAELVTPATWTSEFLPGVMMHASGGQKRLFITTPSSYLQASHNSTAWTWQKLRELPRYHPERETSSAGSHVPEADAKEECWMYRPNLDTLSANSSFASNALSSAADVLTEPTLIKGENSASLLSSILKLPRSQSAASRHLPPISPITDKHIRHRRNRTLSMPLTDAGQRPQSTKRSIASFETGGLRSAMRSTSFGKRRRTRSPSATALVDSQPVASLDYAGQAVFGNWAPTPRRSKEPPSPFFDMRSQGTAESGRLVTSASRAGRAKEGRQETPLPYATPYSGTVMGLGGFSTAGGDTEADSEGGGEEEGEVWEGVGDEEREDDVDAISDVDVGAELLEEGFGEEGDMESDEENKEDEEGSEYEDNLEMGDHDDE